MLTKQLFLREYCVTKRKSLCKLLDEFLNVTGVSCSYGSSATVVCSMQLCKQKTVANDEF